MHPNPSVDRGFLPGQKTPPALAGLGSPLSPAAGPAPSPFRAPVWW